MKKICRSLLLLSPCLLLTTYCEQKYTMLGVSNGRYSTTIWILEDVGGECSYTDLQQVIIDTTRHAVVSQNYYNGDSASAMEFVNKLEKETCVRMEKDANGKFWVNFTLSMESPRRSDRLMEKWRTQAFSHEPTEWNRMMGDSGIVQPTITGGAMKLLYACPKGLYVGYKITSVWVTKDSGIVIVFTDQPQRASGMDTMHGYLVYSLR